MTGLNHGRHPFLLAAGVLAASLSTAAADGSRDMGALSLLLAPSQAAGGDVVSSDERIRARLAERGMQDIQNLRREGDVYRADAVWYGEAVDVHIDAASGEIKQPERLNSKQVETILRISGWRQVGQPERAGDLFSVLVQSESRPFILKIDARTGRIIEAAENTFPQEEVPTSQDLPQR